MKKLLTTIATILTVTAASAEETIIHNDCFDGTFFYNFMTLSETETELKLTARGWQMFRVDAEDDWQSGNDLTDIVISKEECQFSDDRKLMSCYVGETQMTKRNRFWDEDGERIEEEMVDLEYLQLSIRHVEGVGFNQTGFELNAVYGISSEVEGEEEPLIEQLSTQVLFPGERAVGCDGGF